MKQKIRYLILLLLLLGSAGFLVLSLEPIKPKKQPQRITSTSKKAEVLVNKHLWQTNHLREQAELRAAAQNSFMAPQIGDNVWPSGNEKRTADGVDHTPDRYETNVYNDLKRDRKEFRLSNPDNVIQAQMQDEDRMQEYEEAYRTEYARQFVENARMNGYEVRLNSDFVVTSVKRLPTKQQFRDPSSEGPSKPQAY